MSNTRKISPKAGNQCFGCGKDNPHGLQLEFEGNPSTAQVWAELIPPQFLAGAANTMHGGFISLLLDEASSKVMSLLGKTAVTRNLEVSFEKPVMLDKVIRLEASLVSTERRKNWIDARLLGPEGHVLAKSHALFLQLNLSAKKG